MVATPRQNAASHISTPKEIESERTRVGKHIVAFSSTVPAQCETAQASTSFEELVDHLPCGGCSAEDSTSASAGASAGDGKDVSSGVSTKVSIGVSTGASVKGSVKGSAKGSAESSVEGAAEGSTEVSETKTAEDSPTDSLDTGEGIPSCTSLQVGLSQHGLLSTVGFLTLSACNFAIAAPLRLAGASIRAGSGAGAGSSATAATLSSEVNEGMAGGASGLGISAMTRALESSIAGAM